MTAALLALVLQGGALEQEKERLRSKAPLTLEEKRAYSYPEAIPPAERAFRLAAIPLSFADRGWVGTEPEELFARLPGWLDRVSGGRLRASVEVAREPVRLDVARAEFTDRNLVRGLEASGNGADGVAFVATGPLGARGTPLWPHWDSLESRGKRVDYILLAEESGEKALGIAAHEFMHLLGLPDKYDDEKAQVGADCLMGTGYNVVPPASPCADCRVRVGWAAAAEIDPRREARLVLPADPTRVLRVPLNADATEALLLEFRGKLLVWRVGGGKRIELVGRYPTESSDRLTPLSDPSFRGRTAGAWPVWLTDIRIEDGRAWFRVGPEAPLTPLEEWRRAHVGMRIGD